MKKLAIFLLLVLSLAACSSKNNNSGGGGEPLPAVEYYEKETSTGIETLTATFSKGSDYLADKLEYITMSADREKLTLDRYSIAYDSEMNPLSIEHYFIDYSTGDNGTITYQNTDENFQDMVDSILGLYEKAKNQQDGWKKNDGNILRSELYDRIVGSKIEVAEFVFNRINGNIVTHKHTRMTKQLEKIDYIQYTITYDNDSNPTMLTRYAKVFATDNSSTNSYEAGSQDFQTYYNDMMNLYAEASSKENDWKLVGEKKVVDDTVIYESIEGTVINTIEFNFVSGTDFIKKYELIQMNINRQVQAIEISEYERDAENNIIRIKITVVDSEGNERTSTLEQGDESFEENIALITEIYAYVSHEDSGYIRIDEGAEPPISITNYKNTSQSSINQNVRFVVISGTETVKQMIYIKMDKDNNRQALVKFTIIYDSENNPTLIASYLYDYNSKVEEYSNYSSDIPEFNETIELVNAYYQKAKNQQDGWQIIVE